jgi:antitoxin VapB
VLEEMALIELDNDIYQDIYYLEGTIMQTAKLFTNGRSQAVRLPKNYQFEGKDVYIQKHGDIVILIPHEKAWEVFIHGIDSFSDDFMKEGRDQGKEKNRESF